MLRDADSGSLPHDLARTLVDAANEVVEHTVLDSEISLDELNDMFGLDLGDHVTDTEKMSYTIPIDNREEGACVVGDLLVTEEDFEDLIGVVAETCSLIDASPDGALGVWEFTVDDGVYYFAHAGDFEIQWPEWWFGHTVNDDDARKHWRGVGPRELWDEEMYAREQASD